MSEIINSSHLLILRSCHKCLESNWKKYLACWRFSWCITVCLCGTYPE